ncbi:DnaJ domain-containing protein [bacterium]|nr:DnaJ domain-containing protein [bacterium]
MQTDYYQLLGVNRQVTHDGLKRAFRARLLDVHPDVNHADCNASDVTRQVIEAYHVLADPLSRCRYDMTFIKPPPPIVALDGVIVSRFAMSFLCTFKKLIAGVMLIIGAMVLMWAIVRDKPPVFRAKLIDQHISAPARPFKDVIEPQSPDYLEWYGAREYRLFPANRWAAAKVVETYSKAARIAASDGDKQSLAFYRNSLIQIRSDGF